MASRSWHEGRQPCEEVEEFALSVAKRTEQTMRTHIDNTRTGTAGKYIHPFD